MVQLINIKPEHFRIIPFLYPRYSIVDELQKPVEFILQKDITNPRQRQILFENYDDCIVVSTKVYDTFWDESFIQQKALDFAKTNFHSRKRTLSIPTDDPDQFIESVITFMFTQQLPTVEEDRVLPLFQAFGSSKFSDLFMQLIQQYPAPKVIASMITFISRIRPDSTNVFYLKKDQALGSKIRSNFLKAFDYLKTYQDPNYLHYLKFFQLLVS